MRLYAVQAADSDDAAELLAPAPGVDATPPAVADAHLGRALAKRRRRQLSRGKQALTGGGSQTAAETGTGAPAFVVRRGGAR